jgi:diaminopimelate epimerase
MIDPTGVSLDMPIQVMSRRIRVNYINTGVPHVVIFVQGLNTIDVQTIGRAVRVHKKFKPQGTNVNFVEVIKDNHIKVRTYERGVEAETFSCGTGSVASALILALQQSNNRSYNKRTVKVQVHNGEILRVTFDRSQQSVHNVWLKGGAYVVYRGEFKPYAP